MPIVYALLVGGPADIRRDQERHLEPEGVEVIDHWTWDQRTGAHFAQRIPRRAQLVLLVRDMMGHKHSQVAVKLAKRDGVPVVYGTRKWSETRPLVLAAIARLPREPEPAPVLAVATPEPVAPEAPRPVRALTSAENAAFISAAELVIAAIDRAFVPRGTDPPAPPSFRMNERADAMQETLLERVSSVVEQRVTEFIDSATAAIQAERDALRAALVAARDQINLALGTQPFGDSDLANTHQPQAPRKAPGKVYKRSPEARAKMSAAQQRRRAEQAQVQASAAAPVPVIGALSPAKKTKRTYTWKSEAIRRAAIEARTSSREK